MIAAVESYLALRRLAGFTLSNTEYLLRSFARFARDREESFVQTTTVLTWASQGPSLAQRHTRYETVRRFAVHAQLDDPQHESPPAHYFGYRTTRRPPRLYTPAEIDQLLAAARRLTPPDLLRPHTYGALISLLAATGLRISEALALQVSDLSGDGLLIRKTKFQKTRVVPLHATAVTGLERYLRHPARRPFMGFSRWGVAHILKCHGITARGTCALLARKRLSPHVLRHTSAMIVLQATHDIRKVSLWLGHSQLTTTEMYVRADPSEKLEAIEAIVPPRLRQGTFRPTDALLAWLKAPR